MAHSMKGIIAIWSGAIVDIPFGWKLCDGNNGTPDLRDRFIVGAGTTYSPDATGGSAQHLHTANLGTHAHDLTGSDYVAGGTTYDHVTATALVSGSTDNASSLPPFYALAFIMHI